MSANDSNSNGKTPSALVLCEMGELDGYAIATLTLNRPKEMNPLDHSTVKELRGHLVKLSSDGVTRAVIITGADPAFSAGGDLKGYQDLYRTPDAFSGFLDDLNEVCDVLERGPAITVAMVNGTCVAGGLELALACDFITIGDEALIGDGHLRFGQLPGAGGSQRLVRAIGLQRARQWLLSARLFNASSALDAGLVVGAFPHDRLQDETLALLRPMLSHSPLATSKMKELISLASNNHLTDGLIEEMRIVHDYAVTSHDATEGLTAFEERRKPIYRGT